MRKFHWKIIKNKFKQKKYITITVISVLCLTPIIILLSEPQNPASSNIIIVTPTVAIQNINDSSGNNPQSVNPNLPKWSTYKGATYSMQYSPDWSVQINKTVGGGEMAVVRPNILPKEINYPQFILQTEPYTESGLQQKMAFMKGLGMKQSEITVLGKQAQKLSGTIPYKLVAGKKVNEPIQETNILLIDKNSLYLFQYSYEGGETSEALEKYFNDYIIGIHLE